MENLAQRGRRLLGRPQCEVAGDLAQDQLDRFRQFNVLREVVRDRQDQVAEVDAARRQALVDDRILSLLEEWKMDPAVIYAFRKTGILLEEANEHRASEQELAVWKAALAEFRLRKAG